MEIWIIISLWAISDKNCACRGYLLHKAIDINWCIRISKTAETVPPNLMENAGYEPCQHSDELVSLSWGFAALKLEELWSFRRSRNGHWMSKDTNRCHLRDILLCYAMLPFHPKGWKEVEHWSRWVLKDLVQNSPSLQGPFVFLKCPNDSCCICMCLPVITEVCKDSGRLTSIIAKKLWCMRQFVLCFHSFGVLL